MKKRMIALWFAVVMVCSMQGRVVATSYSSDREIPVSNYHDENLDIDPVNQDEIPRTWSSSDDTLESSYISPYVTTVKDQNPYGTCWAFSFVAASEASMVKEGLASLGDNEVAEVNLSELHLAYFLSHSVTDPLGGTVGDCFSITDTSLNAFLERGGNQELATYRVANWYGLVDETTAPYSSIVSTESVVLEDSLAYGEDVVHLKNAYWISMQDRDVVKQFIKDFGAGAASYCSKDAYYNTGNASSWNQTEAVAVYCPDDINTNHGITIVGWDDEYSADNFDGTYKPSSDGAWYCKNSWGSEWSKDGYFWVSYEDVPMNSGTVFFYDYETADNYDKNYQYDGGAVDGVYACNYEANIYTAQDDEYIRAVGFYTYDSNYDCTIKIYKNCTTSNPATGTLIASMAANQLYSGFHTVELEDKYLLRKGETFSVVIYKNATDEDGTYIATDSNYSAEGVWCSNTSFAVSGQSFISSSANYWQDISSDGDNCRIKAYTDIVPEEDKIKVSTITLNKSAVALCENETIQLTANILPADAFNTKVTWSTTDANVATVDSNGMITAVGPGAASIICSADDRGGASAQCEVTVKSWVEEVQLDWKTREMMQGDTFTLQATLLPSNASDMSVQWSSSDNQVVTVSDEGLVTAVGYGTATITCTATDRNIYQATCIIKVYESITSILLDGTSVTLNPQQSMQLQVTTTPSIDKTKGVYWVSSDEDVVSVDSSNGLLTAKALGENILISCIAKDGSGLKATCTVTVENSVIIRASGEVFKDLVTGADYQVINGGTENATVQLLDGSLFSGVVTIPLVVQLDGVDYKVTSIADNAFKNNKMITEVAIGSNITKIGKNAFYGCKNLHTIIMGNNVKSIGSKAFYNCKKLKKATIGKNVTSIGDKAFYQCSKLSKLVIPSKVSKIGKQAFYKCKSLKTITIKTNKLTKKKVGSKAFTGIHSKATIKVPKKKLKSYKAMLKARGIGKKVKVKKY